MNLFIQNVQNSRLATLGLSSGDVAAAALAALAAAGEAHAAVFSLNGFTLSVDGSAVSASYDVCVVTSVPYSRRHLLTLVKAWPWRSARLKSQSLFTRPSRIVR